MAATGPIILVEDDPDDKEILEEVLREMKISNQLIWFDTCRAAYQYLQSAVESPFVILSDINLPLQTGIEFKRQIDADPQLRSKSIPFVFLSTSTRQADIDEAYGKTTVQGFFQKSGRMEDLKRTLTVIFQYWELSQHPNT